MKKLPTKEKKVWMNKKNDDSDIYRVLYSGYKKIRIILFWHLFVKFFKQRYTKSVKIYKYLKKFISYV